MSTQNRFAVADAGEPLRQCALMLHAVRTEDRAWLLANLGDARASELERLVGELKSLGIPADAGAAQLALQRADKARAAAARVVSPGPADTKGLGSEPQEVEASHLGELLRDEPLGLIAQVLGVYPGKQKAVLAQLARSRRKQFRKYLSSVPAASVAPCALQALEDQVSSRLASRRDTGTSQPRKARILRQALQLLQFARASS